jgi:hypothetical protein
MMTPRAKASLIKVLLLALALAVAGQAAMRDRAAQAQTVQTVQQIPGTSGLSGIACPSVDTCYAVGSLELGGALSLERSDIPDSTGVLVTLSSGSVTNVRSVDGTLDLASIACDGPSSCYATATPRSDPRGTVILPIVNGAPGDAVDLSGYRLSGKGLVCPGGRVCLALAITDAGDSVLLLLQQGRPVRSYPFPEGFDLGGFSPGAAIFACPASVLCYVLVNPARGGLQYQVLRANGTDFVSLSSLPNGFIPQSLVCANLASCYAFGELYDANGSGINFIEAQISAGNLRFFRPISATQILGGDCSQNGSCVAVGQRSRSALIGNFTADSFGNVNLVADLPAEPLTAIACPGQTTCYAAGGFPGFDITPSAALPSGIGVIVTIDAGAGG